MASKPRPVRLPSPEYSVEDQNIFRRELEDYFLELSSDVSGIETGSSTTYSLSSKMNILSMTGVGQEVVPEYYEGSLTVGRTNVPSWAAVDYEVACVGTRQGMFVDVAVSGLYRATEDGLFAAAFAGTDEVHVQVRNYRALGIFLPAGDVKVKAWL